MTMYPRLFSSAFSKTLRTLLAFWQALTAVQDGLPARLRAAGLAVSGLGVLLLVAGCNSDPGETPSEETPPEPVNLGFEGRWQSEPLTGALEGAPEDNPETAPGGLAVTMLSPDRNGRLLVGTSDGLFRRQGPDTYESLGLSGRELVGVAELESGALLASVWASSADPGGAVLFRLGEEEASSQDPADGNVSWEPFMGDYGGDRKYAKVGSGPVAATPGSDTLFAGGPALVARSTDRGAGWRLLDISDESPPRWDYGGMGRLLRVDTLHPGLILAGGMNSLSAPYLLRSTDYGASWERTNREVLMKVDTTLVKSAVYDAVAHPKDAERLLVGFGGGISGAQHVKRSADGGESWEVVLRETGARTLSRSARNAGAIYVSGRDPSGRPFFAATADFGDTWTRKTFEGGPAPVVVNDLASLMVEGQEVLFVGTDQGLFSFRFE